MLLKIINFLLPFWAICLVITLLFTGYTSFKMVTIKRKHKESYDANILFDNFSEVDTCMSIIVFLNLIIKTLLIISAGLYIFVLLEGKWIIAAAIIVVSLCSKMDVPIVASILSAYITENYFLLLCGVIYILVINILIGVVPSQIASLVMATEKK